MASLSTLNWLCMFLSPRLALPFSSIDKLLYNFLQGNKEFEDWPLMYKCDGLTLAGFQVLSCSSMEQEEARPS